MIKVTHKPALVGPAAWTQILGPQPSYGALDGHQTCDVTIIGGGFAGLSAARRLLELDPNLSIAIVDALTIGQGSAGRNSGFMIDLPHDLASEDYAGAGDDRATIDLNRQAIEFAARAVQDYEIDPNYFDRAGKINGAATAAAHHHNGTYAQHLTTLGEKSDLLDRQQMHEITGSRHYIGGLYSPGTVMLQPGGYVCGLARGLHRNGLRIYEQSPVVAMTRRGSAWDIETPKGRLHSDRVILTVNGHLESFGFAKRRLMQLFLFAVMTPKLDADALARLGGHSRWGITPSDPMGTTVRRIDTGQGGNRIVTRTCAALRPNMAASPKDVTRAAAVMQAKFDERFPQLKGMKMEHSWSGHLCLTRNGVAVAREVEQGLFAGCVQNGLGTARGTLTGIAAAETALGYASDITKYFQAEAPPSKLAPSPLLHIGGNTVLRYKEWRARRD